MASSSQPSPFRTLLRILFGALIVLAMFIFILWRTENPRLQQLRFAILDAVSPAMSSIAGPTNSLSNLFSDFESFSELQRDNSRLRQQIERLRAWRDIAQRLEEENARLRALNSVKPSLRTGYVTAEVIGDAGGPFAQSALLNVGARDGVVDGAPAIGAVGLAGRISGVGETTARLLLLTDSTSRTPVLIGAEKQRAILLGDNRREPVLKHAPDDYEPAIGDVVVTSGHGGVFPAGVHIGRVVSLDEGQVRVRLAQSQQTLEFLRIYRSERSTAETPLGGLILRAAPNAEGEVGGGG